MNFSWKRGLSPVGTMDASVLCPSAYPGATCTELGALKIAVGNREYRWDDVFSIAGDTLQHWNLPGNENYLYLGQGLAGGSIKVTGHAGDYAGVRVQGGVLSIEGDAGFRLGAGMTGGYIWVTGNAGAEVGGPAPGLFTGMSDGEILIQGVAGARAGFRMCRGLIAAGGVSEFAGYELQAGTLIIQRGPLLHPGMHMKRGTIVLLDARVTPGWSHFTAECIMEPVIVRMMLRRLKQLKYLFPSDAIDGRYQLYSGDTLLTGQGELMVLVR